MHLNGWILGLLEVMVIPSGDGGWLAVMAVVLTSHCVSAGYHFHGKLAEIRQYPRSL